MKVTQPVRKPVFEYAPDVGSSANVSVSYCRRMNSSHKRPNTQFTRLSSASRESRALGISDLQYPCQSQKDEECGILPQIEHVSRYDDPRTELQRLRHVRYPQPKEVTEEAQEDTRTIEL